MELEEVKDITFTGKETMQDLVEAYEKTHGFMAGHLTTALKILAEGLSKSQLRMITITANLVSTGLRGLFAQLIRTRIFNTVFTTAGTLDHDIARAMGGKYLKGVFDLDDKELYEKGYHRLGNILIPVQDYGPLVEMFVRDLVGRALSEKKRWGVRELLTLAGSMINDRNSILKAAYESGAKIFVPGWPDGAFGTALFTESQRQGDLIVDYFIDMKELAEIFFTTKTPATALIIGGGISKHHAIWWSQFREGLDYAVYLTTACEYDGSLSGARPREAISWGKLKKTAQKTVVYADATLVMPIIGYYLIKKFAQ